MTRLGAVLLYLAYKMQNHFFFRISLRDWLWGLVFVPPIAGLLNRLTWPRAIPLSLLGTVLLIGIEWARRQGYLIFVPEDVTAPAGALPLIAVDEQMPCRASGLFAVTGRKRHMVNEHAQISYVRTREHVVMTRLRRTRFLLFARSLAGEAGWWYVFFLPEHVQRVQTGHVLCGLRSRPGLSIRYLCAERGGREEVFVLAFERTDDLRRVLRDLERDAPADAFEGAPDRTT